MEFSKDTLLKMLTDALSVVRGVGNDLISFDNPIPHFRKTDATLSTNSEESAETRIVETLSGIYGEFGFLGEEFGARGPQDARWIIDPVDGSIKRIFGIPGWSVMLAFEAGGEVLLGIIYDPLSGAIFTARKGCGAFANESRIYVSGQTDIAESLLLHSGWLNHAIFHSSLDKLRGLASSFDSHINMDDYEGWMYVAQGRAQAAVHLYLGIEDMAAPSIIIKEAGGIFTDLHGFDSIYNGHAVVSCDRKMHEEILRVLNS